MFPSFTTALIGGSSQGLFNQDEAARDDLDSPPMMTAVLPQNSLPVPHALSTQFIDPRDGPANLFLFIWTFASVLDNGSPAKWAPLGMQATNRLPILPQNPAEISRTLAKSRLKSTVEKIRPHQGFLGWP
jgi:hypothetical protein